MKSRNPFSRFSTQITISKSESKDDNVKTPDHSPRIRKRRSLFTAFTKSQPHGSVSAPILGLDTGGDTEKDWEKRATILAHSPGPSALQKLNRSEEICAGSVPEIDLEKLKRIGEEEDRNLNVEELMNKAIYFHESGDLERATRLFGQIANMREGGSSLAQLLYGLSLRHGWGCSTDPDKALAYLKAAAQSAADFEITTFSSKVGKGALTLAIYELGNSYRNGWGVKKDDVTARQHYEVAARLGDADAMAEVAYCYLHGVGCKTNKKMAARYYRMAEEKGNKEPGLSWIWKDKYALNLHQINTRYND